MKIQPSTLEKIAHMAALELSSEQKKNMQADLSKMLAWVQKLQEVDTKSVKPVTTLSYEVNQLCEDQPEPPMSQEEALINAPAANKPYFCVPAVKD